MAFVCTVKKETFDAEVFQHGNSYAAVINVGYDADSDRGYSLVVGLEPMAGGELEYFFHILETDRKIEYKQDYWCGKDVAEFISKEDRQAILQVLVSATCEMLDLVRPEKVNYISHDVNPPDKALVKHGLIASGFERCGYQVHTADPYHGKRVWWMERLADQAVATGPFDR